MKYIIYFLSVFFLAGCSVRSGAGEKTNFDTNNQNRNSEQTMSDSVNYQTATFGAGCFWCVEAIFQNVKGVVKVEPGYSNGHVKNPSYREVCTGTTGHAEVAQITFDPSIIRYEDLLEVFWHTHDPTTLNRQGADVGSQYRSAIFYNDDEQKRIAEESKKKTEESGLWENPIVTEITKLDKFYVAEDYHKNYYNNNKTQGYCSVVIAPKLQKFYKEFKHLVKDDAGN